METRKLSGVIYTATLVEKDTWKAVDFVLEDKDENFRIFKNAANSKTLGELLNNGIGVQLHLIGEKGEKYWNWKLDPEFHEIEAKTENKRSYSTPQGGNNEEVLRELNRLNIAVGNIQAILTAAYPESAAKVRTAPAATAPSQQGRSFNEITLEGVPF